MGNETPSAHQLPLSCRKEEGSLLACEDPVVHHCCPQALSSDGGAKQKGASFTQERSHPYVTDLQDGLAAQTFVIKALEPCRSRAQLSCQFPG